MPDKNLNPSPKFPNGEYKEETVTANLGTVYGELSPNPKLTTQYVDGGRGIGVSDNPPTPDQVQPRRDYNEQEIKDLAAEVL